MQNQAVAIAVKVNEPDEMMQLLEMILIEIVEKPAGSDGVSRDLEIVDVPVPVSTNLFSGGHGHHYSSLT